MINAKLCLTMKIFLSHSAHNPVSALRQILASLGAEVFDSFDPNAVANLTSPLPDAIRNADAIVAVVDGPSPNVFFELGFAMATGKPALALQAPETLLPPFLAQVPHLTSDFRDSKALRFTIKKFLHQVGNSEEPIAKPQSPANAVPSSAEMQMLSQQLGELRLNGNPRDAETVLAAFLKAARVRSVERGTADDKGADFAVWSDGVSSTLGNPILIQLKTGRIEKMNFRVTYSNVAYAVQQSGAAAGLLLYLDRRGQRFDKPNTWVPNVFFCDLEDFASRVIREGFDRSLLNLRNEQVHEVAR
jgi:hypothetical protein